MSQFGVVNPIEAPRITDIRQSELIKFEVEYIAYKEKVEDVNRIRQASQKISPATIKQCIDPTMLNSLCILKKIEGASSIEEASDEAVKKWFEESLASAPIDLTERVRSAVDSVVFQLDRRDPSGAVLNFVVNVVSALDKNNSSEVIEDKETCKSLVNKLLNKLEPPELRERVRASRESWTADQRIDLTYFQERSSELAVNVNEGELARARLQKRDKKRGATVIDSKHKSGNKAQDDKRSRMSRSDIGVSSADIKESQLSGRQEWSLPCINENCPEKHHFRDCKNTPEADKEAIWVAWKEKRKTKNSKRFKSNYVHLGSATAVAEATEGRYNVILENAVNALALGDTGSDESVLPNSVYQKIKDIEPKIPCQILNPPIEVRLAIEDNETDQKKFTVSRSIKTTITILLPGSNLPLRLHSVPFYVVDHEMEEILLGRNFLKKIGFDLNSHLHNVSNVISGQHFDAINIDDVKLSSVSYKGLKYNAVDDDPIELPESLGASFGEDSPGEIEDAFNNMLQESKENGLSEEGVCRLRNVLNKYRSVFNIKLGNQPPARVTPLQITLRENVKPFRAPQRRYAPKQRNFLISTIQKLEKVGAIYKNPTSKWASPALAVPKPGSDELRFTVDLRGPNSRTQPIASSMPHLESLIQSVQGSSCYAKVDMAHAYWQLPLAKDSQEILSIQTPLGVYSSSRVLQGGSDSGNHFQAVTEESFSKLSDNKLQWMDDFLLHERSEEKLLLVFEQFLEICSEYGYKVHAKKTHPFLKEARFCGRIITPNGTKFDPRSLKPLIDMQIPTTGAHLQQLLCATNWMRSSIPRYSELVYPLHRLMEDV